MKKTNTIIALIFLTAVAVAHETSEEKDTFHWIADDPIQAVVYATILLIGIGLILLLVLPKFIKIKEK